MKRRGPTFWILSAVILAACGWWMVHVPDRRGRIYSVIPPDPAWCSAHRGLAARLPDLLKSPLAPLLDMAPGFSALADEDVSGSPSFRQWADKLVPEDTVIGLAELPGTGGREALFLASWVGPRSQVLRWQLAFAKARGLSKAATHAGRTIWEWKWPDAPEGAGIHFAFEEGVLLACLSSDSLDVAYFLDLLDRNRAPPSAMVRRLRESTAPHRAIVRWPDADGKPYFVESDRAAAGRADLRIDIPWRGEPPAVMGPSEALASRAWLGAQVIAWCLVDSKMMLSGGWLKSRDPRAVLLRQFVENQFAGPLAAGMCGEGLTGRFKGLRIPGFLFAAPLRSPQTALADLAQLIDRFNALYRWGLVTHPAVGGRTDVMAVEGTTDNFYAGLAPGERFAYAVVEGWLLASPSADVLVRHVDNLHLEAAAITQAAPESPLDATSASLRSRIDIETGERSLQLALSAYSLSLLLDDPEKTQADRERIAAMKKTLASLASMGTIRVTGAPVREGNLELRIEMGGAP